jgi:hypothetical protein
MMPSNGRDMIHASTACSPNTKHGWPSCAEEIPLTAASYLAVWLDSGIIVPLD